MPITRHKIGRAKAAANEVLNRFRKAEQEGKGIGILGIVQLIALVLQIIKLLDELDPDESEDKSHA